MKKALFLLVVLFFSMDAFTQCSQCSLLAEQSGNGEMGSGNNINTGILYIMGIVYIVLIITSPPFRLSKAYKLPSTKPSNAPVSALIIAILSD